MKQLLMSIVLVSFLTPTFSKDKMNLYLNYTALKQWRYVLKYQSVCTIEDSDTTVSQKTRIGCTLHGELSEDKQRLNFTIKKPLVESQLYDSSMIQSLQDSLKTRVYGLAIIDGCPVVDTLARSKNEPLPEWDLYFQFAKLLPDMPQEKVKAGYSWERSAVHPLRTHIGTVPCHVYRLYKVDRVSEAEGAVYISWEFSYKAEKSAMKNTDFLKKIPITGKGSGSATIDLIDGYIHKAKIKFTTPVAQIDEKKVTWTEDMVLEFRFAKE